MEPIVDFSEVLRDSPRFREVLLRTEQSVDGLETRIEKLTKCCVVMVDQRKVYNSAMTSFFDALSDLTEYFEADKDITGWVSEMVKVGRDLVAFGGILVDHGERTFKKNLDQFVQRDIKTLKESRNCFGKLSDELDNTLQRHAQVGRTKQVEVEEVVNLLTARRSCFQHTALDYITQISKFELAKKHKIMGALFGQVQAIKTYHTQALKTFGEHEESFEKASKHLSDSKTNYDKYTMDISKCLESQFHLVSQGNESLCPMVTGEGRLEGYLFKRTSNAFKTWNRRWFVLENGSLLYRKRDGDPKDTVMEQDLRLCTVKMVNDGERRYCFDLVSPHKSHTLQADTEKACKTWVDALLAAIGVAHHNNAHVTVKKLPKALAIEGNKACCDCGAPDPQWASINLGITLCIECSGIHRSLGVHISKVRSLTLDTWEDDTVKIMERLGNGVVNKVYEANALAEEVRARPDSTRSQREEWIRVKYVEKKMVKPLPSLSDTQPQPRWAVAKSGHKCSDLSVLVFGEDLNRNSSAPNLQSSRELKSFPMDQLTPSQLLYESAGADNLSGILYALALGADANYRCENEDLRTPLHKAIAEGPFVVTCEFLLLNGGQHTCVDLQGKTPLHLASQASSVPLVGLLLKKGADRDALDKEGLSALALAIANGNAEVVTLIRLVKFREDLKLEDSDFAATGDDVFDQVMKDFNTMATSSEQVSEPQESS